MGNRCLITNKDKKIAIYQSWNGGRDSIEPLLRVAKYEYKKNPHKFGFEEFKAILDISKKFLMVKYAIIKAINILQAIMVYMSLKTFKL
ncbi:hypothetical protein [Campylobacter coli]|uniref:hypothetical protein n=1 Tax=Campylobacter coli TaxID=195 RepID=UPI003CF28E7F